MPPKTSTIQRTAPQPFVPFSAGDIVKLLAPVRGKKMKVGTTDERQMQRDDKGIDAIVRIRQVVPIGRESIDMQQPSRSEDFEYKVYWEYEQKVEPEAHQAIGDKLHEKVHHGSLSDVKGGEMPVGQFPWTENAYLYLRYDITFTRIGLLKKGTAVQLASDAMTKTGSTHKNIRTSNMYYEVYMTAPQKEKWIWKGMVRVPHHHLKLVEKAR